MIKRSKNHIEKKISYSEYKINKLIQERDPSITVPVIELTNTKLVLERYPMTIYDYLEENGLSEELISKLKSLINRLHEIDIFHGDIHEYNIVVNDKGDIRLIDFGQSIIISKADDFDVNFYCKNWDLDLNSTLDDILSHEENFIPDVLYQDYLFDSVNISKR